MSNCQPPSRASAPNLQDYDFTSGMPKKPVAYMLVSKSGSRPMTIPKRHRPSMNRIPRKVPMGLEMNFLNAMEQFKLEQPVVYGIPRMSKGEVSGFKHAVTKNEINSAIQAKPNITF